MNIDIEITGIDHIYITVSDMTRAEKFYDPVMQLLGFKKRKGPLAGGDFHIHYFNRATQYSIRPATDATAGEHNPYAPGLHHYCWRVQTKAEVDAIAEGLNALGVGATEPDYFPEYGHDYYATFFQDPDGIRLEVTNFRLGRQEIIDDWDEIPWSVK